MATTGSTDTRNIDEDRQHRHEAHADATHRKFLTLASAELNLSEEQAQGAFLAVLRALETRVPEDQMVALASQLPSAVRDQLARCDLPEPAAPHGRKQEDFLEQVAEELEIDPGLAEARVRGAFRVLTKSVSRGQVEKVVHLLPSGVRELWPIS